MEKIAVVIPCYCVRHQISWVLNQIPDLISHIYLIDDCCPEKTGEYVSINHQDRRLKIIYNMSNLGVGGAVKRGYQEALKDQVDIVIKVDGDGQINPVLIFDIIDTMKKSGADYIKGNRFYELESIKTMPALRILGNSILTLVTRFSSGYWNISDPTNGFTAIKKNVLMKLRLEKISNGYFFESDILFRLNIARCYVVDYSMVAVYKNEKSNLSILKNIPIFSLKNLINFLKRIIYSYYIRDFTIASIELPIGIIFISFGTTYGLYEWAIKSMNNEFASAGTVMLSALPIILGFQLLLNFISFDINSTPKRKLY